jgi:hypothetical protein
MWSGLPSHAYDRCSPWKKILENVPHGTLSSFINKNLDICQSIALLQFTYCKALALHNVSYYTHIHIICSFYDTLYLKAYKL